MKLLVALDRLQETQAMTLIKAINSIPDIIEIGTSFTKEFGVAFIKQVRTTFPQLVLFADIKTIDEAAYEFDLYYQAGADILSVMGGASLETLRIARQVAQQHKKRYLIDILEADYTMIKKVQEFQDAIFCIHLPKDQTGDIVELVKQWKDQLPKHACIAVAGGIQLQHISALQQQKVDILMVGGSITNALDPVYAAQQFQKGMMSDDRNNETNSHGNRRSM